MDTANEELSKRLHEVLDVIGASQYIREKYSENAVIHETIQTFLSLTYSKSSNEVFYEVGSRYEGTTTQNFYADYDMIRCFPDSPVVEKLFESKKQGFSFLILTDEDTHPGYVRLQIVEDRCLRTAENCGILDDKWFLDCKDNVCANNYSPTHDDTISNTIRNGPATTYPAHGHCRSIDMVRAYRCRDIPSSDNSWLHRIRNYGWPSQKQLKAMGSYGSFFVGVGHPHSTNKSSEWRISFTLQERDLMSSLNETQHKCYILLKMIKKDIIEPNAGESISSYHCKTCILYTIENSHSRYWTNDKLILCLQQCLKRLFIWVKAKNCPNYFIPNENMFDKLSLMTLEKIDNVLNDILESGMKFLYSLTCDSVGEFLKSKLCGDKLECILTNITLPLRFVACFDITITIYILGIQCMQQICCSSITTAGYMNGMMQLLLYLKHTNHITEHTTRDVRMVLDSILPHIKLQYEQCMYSQYLLQGTPPGMLSMTIPNIISDIGEYDLISSELSLTSLYIQFEQYHEECKRILFACESKIEQCVVSVCGCDVRIREVNFDLAEKMRFTDMSSKEFRHCTTGCMVFHPSQASLVHKALQYEMFRTVFTQSGSENEMSRDHWLNWITVDSQIYLYFLQFVLYSKTRQPTDLIAAMQKLHRVSLKDPNIGHKETGCNLLGWICVQLNAYHSAWKLLCISWKRRPFKNAAKWHMLILLGEII